MRDSMANLISVFKTNKRLVVSQRARLEVYSRLSDPCSRLGPNVRVLCVPLELSSIRMDQSTVYRRPTEDEPYCTPPAIAASASDLRWGGSEDHHVMERAPPRAPVCSTPGTGSTGWFGWFGGENPVPNGLFVQQHVDDPQPHEDHIKRLPARAALLPCNVDPYGVCT